MNILLGVSGGIAAYKACILCSTAKKQGHDVRVIMTNNATNFVGQSTFEGLSENPVLIQTFEDTMAHIELAKWCDLSCVVPMTANLLAKLATGICDDLLTTTLLAIPASTPVVLCPAMNTHMWNHPITQRNLTWLKDLKRYLFISPIEKRLACGDYGIGALAEPDTIWQVCQEQLASANNPIQPLHGKPTKPGLSEQPDKISNS